MTDSELLDAVSDAGQGFRVMQMMAARFGWTAGTRDRNDVESWFGRPLTDEEWERVISTDSWENYFDNLDDDRMGSVLEEAGVA